MWPCGVNTTGSIDEIYTINHVSTPESICQQNTTNRKASVNFLANLSMVLTFENQLYLGRYLNKLIF